MAANCVRRVLLSSSPKSSPASSSILSSASKLVGGLGSAKPTSARLPRHKLRFSSRLPVELSCAQSLMPLHSITASALLTSMLKCGNWGWLSEGFATPL